MKKVIGNPQKTNKFIINKIKNTKINYKYVKTQMDYRDQILNEINIENDVLDIGKGMREKFQHIHSKTITTLDMNDFGDYPDIIFDICDDLNPNLHKNYDRIICLAILEHVYNPFLAVDNIFKMLKKDGILFGYVPFLYYYHAPDDLNFQDYFRFSKDALIYLLKDFQDLELFPIRGRASTPLHLLFGKRWKTYIEKTKFNIFIDKFMNDEKNSKQTSGYFFIAKK